MTYVLVVDDEAPICRLLSRWLQGWGYTTKEAGTAAEALEVMMAEPASIMLCDIRMPGHDGMWLLERVRARWPKTAVIMATGVDDMQTVAKSQRQGVVDYVTKPFGRELLLQALRRAEAALGQDPSTPPASSK
jgi:DNA-binding NtrC family response regulator